MFDNSQLGLVRQDELTKARIEAIFKQTLILDEDDFQKAIDNNTIEVYTEENIMLFKSDLAKKLSESNDLDQVLEKAKKDLSKLVKTTVIGKDGVKRTVWIKRKEYKSHTEHNVEEIKATIKRQESLIANPKSPASAVARAKKILEVETAKLKGGEDNEGKLIAEKDRLYHEAAANLKKLDFGSDKYVKLSKEYDSKIDEIKNKLDSVRKLGPTPSVGSMTSKTPKKDKVDIDDALKTLKSKSKGEEKKFSVGNTVKFTKESGVENSTKLTVTNVDSRMNRSIGGWEQRHWVKMKGENGKIYGPVPQSDLESSESQDTPVTVAKEDRSAEFKIPEKPIEEDKRKELTRGSWKKADVSSNVMDWAKESGYASEVKAVAKWIHKRLGTGVSGGVSVGRSPQSLVLDAPALQGFVSIGEDFKTREIGIKFRGESVKNQKEFDAVFDKYFKVKE